MKVMKTTPSVHECSPEEYAAALTALSRPDKPVSFLQAPFYGAWQARDGKTVVYFAAQEDHGGPTTAAGLAVKYDAPGGISFFYCPYGPVVQAWTPELLDAIREFFGPVCKRTGASFVRLDDNALTETPGVAPMADRLAVTASLQPRAEWLLDISGRQEDIWMGLHKHARYNVRLAERAHATLDFYAPAEAPLDTFFSLMQTTAGRDSFSIQSRAYYEAVLSSVPADSGFVAVCSIGGKPAAAALFAAYDGVLHYVFAGSSNDFRKIAPPYFVIWNSILEAKKRGWHTLNFGGISDDVKGTHLAGVTGFKQRFGGYRVTHPNPVDLVYKPLKYTLFSLYKRLRG
jgi:lipid II:glycine glycyltransferase (peptidoglycan interpeptide bridge formation enzyme)